MTEYDDPDAAVDDAAVRAMVRACRPSWRVADVERLDEGTDFVAVVHLAAADDSATDEDGMTPDDGATTDDAVGGRGAEPPDLAVLKATTAGFVAPEIARSEPRFFERLATETSIPVPDVYGYCDRHDALPAPFYLVEYVDGETVTSDDDVPAEPAVRRTLREAGANLAELHELGPLEAVGTVGVRDGDLAVVETDDDPTYDDAREAVAAEFDDVLDALADGTWFPERALEPDRFADLVPACRAYAEETVPSLPEPEPPTYCHWDYRWGNLLVDPETGATTAVLDWANLSAIEPAYNLAKVEASTLDVGGPNAEVVEERRDAFREAYVDARDDDWAFTSAVAERMDCYRLLDELQSMACLPLWHADATPAERDAIEADHRAVVAGYV